MPNPFEAAHLGSGFPIPPLHMPTVPLLDFSKIEASGRSDPTLNSLVAHNPNQPHFVDPYKLYLGLHQAQLPLPQQGVSYKNQAVLQACTTKPSSSKETRDHENDLPGRRTYGRIYLLSAILLKLYNKVEFLDEEMRENQVEFGVHDSHGHSRWLRPVSSMSFAQGGPLAEALRPLSVAGGRGVGSNSSSPYDSIR
ncbi:unnamed protein product [Fraxinus pennsylvanica]|uniref:Uncharacterized protein n=1 Tax=Fraxinus pennsylvanica TaxID=56036 RepID=A0AAD1Z2W7_9LAMI|nr:unnamed protein product [Fraxinus pennsylvanica]